MNLPALWHDPYGPKHHVRVLAIDAKSRLAAVVFAEGPRAGSIAMLSTDQLTIGIEAEMTHDLIHKLRALTRFSHGDSRGVHLGIHARPDGTVEAHVFVELENGRSITVERHDDDIETLLCEAEEKARAAVSS
jgi:hypothetical protein